MNRLLKLTMEDIGKRQKSFIPIWLLGTGADFGNLQNYAKSLCVMLLVNIFYKEINGDGSRSREELIDFIKEVCEISKFKYVDLECEKIVDSLLSNEGKNYTFAFEQSYYNEKTQGWESFKFQYLEIDRDFSDLYEGKLIYKLSEEAQELVLMSHEVIQSMDISIQQLVTQILIEKGNLKSALDMMDALDFRVRKLINSEKKHKEELIRDPEKIIYSNQHSWGNNIMEVDRQFRDELERYTNMKRILDKLETVDEEREIFIQLKKRIGNTMNLHDKLAKLVVENIRLELEILNNEFDLMWSISTTSFRKTIWEENVIDRGFERPEDMLLLVELILSPHNTFLLPIEWGVVEQHQISHSDVFDIIDKEDDNDISNPIVIDWDRVVQLWEPVFMYLLNEGEVSTDYIRDIDEGFISKWTESKEALDFWMSFGSLEEPMIITEEVLSDTEDLKVVLINKLIQKNLAFKALLNKELSSFQSDVDDIILEDSVEISDFKIYLKDVVAYGG